MLDPEGCVTRATDSNDGGEYRPAKDDVDDERVERKVHLNSP